LRDDFDTITEGAAFAHFWQLILVFSIAALILTERVNSPTPNVIAC
jgi:hypothetical protein